ncbi:MAG: hypothetical protein HKN33_18780 [Pyrinomonadaceae bacterium]|nr:hypothetical protein [Pyrinomonadaceae bacterium]
MGTYFATLILVFSFSAQVLSGANTCRCDPIEDSTTCQEDHLETAANSPKLLDAGTKHACLAHNTATSIVACDRSPYGQIVCHLVLAPKVRTTHNPNLSIGKGNKSRSGIEKHLSPQSSLAKYIQFQAMLV